MPGGGRRRERLARAWRRLRGGALTPRRAALSVAVGLAIGVTPLWGLHWAIVLAVCVPLRLDAGVAFLASNVSLPFVAPFITFAELEVGARLVRGAWLALEPSDVRALPLRDLPADMAVGVAMVAAASAGVGGALTWLVVGRARGGGRRARATARRPGA